MTGLEALDNLVQSCFNPCDSDEVLNDKAIVEKSLKALEIIKEKNVAVAMLKSCENVKRYNTIAFDEEHFKDKNYARKLTQEEFNLLIEVLE